MKFVSHIKRMSVQIQARRVEYLAGGIEREIIPGYTAEFKDADLTLDELAFAQQTFQHINGRTVEIDEVTPTPLLNRLSTYDTEDPGLQEVFAQIDEDMGKPAGSFKAKVEEKLLSRQSDEMKVVAEAKVPAPWPNYNSFQGSVDDLVQRVIDDGFDLRQTLAFERQNLARANVVEGLEFAIELQTEEDEQAAASGSVVNA